MYEQAMEKAEKAVTAGSDFQQKRATCSESRNVANALVGDQLRADTAAVQVPTSQKAHVRPGALAAPCPLIFIHTYTHTHTHSQQAIETFILHCK